MRRRALLYSGILTVSAATLAFELTLTRLFAVAEWYHFAFLSISVALLGYASSGTWLSILSSDARSRLQPINRLAFPPSLLGCYLLINTIPFDSYQLTWSPMQAFYLVLYYMGLVIPFVLSGSIIAYHLASAVEQSNAIYAANLAGSAIGSLGLLFTLPAFGGEGSVVVAAILGTCGAALLFAADAPKPGRSPGMWTALLLSCLGGILLWSDPPWLSARLSPYKSLSYALQTPGASLAYQRWNAHSRVDVVESEHVHSAPGLSLQYRGKLPAQYGMTIDGDNLSAISRRQEPADETFLEYVPGSLAYRLRPHAYALLIQPRGGLDVAVALHHGADRVLVAEDNALVVQVVRERYDRFTGGLYRDERVRVHLEDGRSALQRGQERYDIVQFCLKESFHPLTLGSYSLAEDYLYTVEAMSQALQRLTPSGILLIMRWLQDPPSEAVRAAAILVTAMEKVGIARPAEHLMALRSWSTMALLASPSPFTQEDVATLLATCQRLGYDVVHYPGIDVTHVNRYNILPEPLYYNALQALLDPQRRTAFYRAQSHDVTPVSDDRPFFAHYFRWRQVPRILAQLGKSWQPFGGSGFLLVLALLLLAVVMSALLIGLPLALRRAPPTRRGHSIRILLYFAALGFGYLLVEMPLMQQFILYLGQPAISFILVLATLLLSAGWGSIWSPRLRLGLTLPLLVALILPYPGALRALFGATLGWPYGARVLLAVSAVLPLGFLMGIPFAAGLRRVEGRYPGIVPWIWAINGGASVVSSILATVLALLWGYRLVLGCAALCYLLATLAFWPLIRSHDLQ